MGSFNCTCGAVTQDGPVYKENSWICFLNSQTLELETTIANKSVNKTDIEEIEDIVQGEMNERFVAMFRCPVCQKIYISSSDNSNEWDAYKPDGKV